MQIIEPMQLSLCVLCAGPRQLWTAPGQLWAAPGSSGQLLVALDGSWQHRARRTDLQHSYPVEERKEMQQCFEAVI